MVLISEKEKKNSTDETFKQLIYNDNSKFMKVIEIRKVLGINWNISRDELELENKHNVL